MTVAPTFSFEISHSQKLSVVLFSLDICPFLPQALQADFVVTGDSVQSNHTLCATQRLGLCSNVPHHDFKQ